MSAGPDDLLLAILKLTEATDKLAAAQQAEHAQPSNRLSQSAAPSGPDQWGPVRELIEAHERFRTPGQRARAEADQLHDKNSGEAPDSVDRLTAAIEKLIKANEDAAKQLRKDKAEAAEMARKADPLGKLLGAYRQASMGMRVAGGAARSGNLSGALEGVLASGRGFGAAAGAAGGAAAAAATGVGAIVGVVAAAVAFKVAMDEATRSTIAHYREMGKFSSALAAVLAQRDVRDMLREKEKGDRLAGVAQNLTRAEQDRKDAGKEIEIAWEEMKAGFLTEYNRLLTDILKEVTDVVKWVKERFGIKDANYKPDTLGKMVERVSKEAEQKWARHKALVPPLGKGPGDF